MMTTEGLTIIPILQYSFEEYEVRKHTEQTFQNIVIQGLTVRIEQVNNSKIKKNDKESNIKKVKLAHHPWQVTDVHPWCKYNVAVQFVTKKFGTSLFSETVELEPADLNVLFNHRDLKDELEWAKHYKEYSSQVDLKKAESLLREYTTDKNDYDNFVKKIKVSEKLKEGGFRPRDVKVIRISGVVPNMLDEPKITQSPRIKKTTREKIRTLIKSSVYIFEFRIQTEI
eukprot:UN34699